MKPSGAQEKWTVERLKGNTHETYGKKFGQIVCGKRAISPVMDYDDACQTAEAHNATLQPQSDDTKRMDWLEKYLNDDAHPINSCLAIKGEDFSIKELGIRQAIDAAMRKDKK